MFVLYILLPVLAMLLSEILRMKREGIGSVLKSKGFWALSAVSVFFNAVLITFLFMDFGAILSVSLWKLLATAISSVFFVCLVKGIIVVRKKKSAWAMLVLALVVALFLEGTVFNFRFYQTADYEEIDVTESMVCSPYFVPIEGEENLYKTIGSSPYFTLKGIQCKVHNVYLDLTARNSKDVIVNAYVDVYMTDESNENYLRLPAQTIMAEVESTKYLHLVTNGESENLKIVVTSNSAKTYQLDGIRLNVPRPMSFEILRVLVITCLIFIFWLIRPGSPLYSHPFTDSLKQRTVIIVVAFLEIVLLLVISVLNPIFQRNPSSHTAQYQELAQSFLAGQLYLEEEPPEYLALMDNPYDINEREQLEAFYEESYYWDAAYFEGRYYVYFGVVPVLLLYLPFQAITHSALPNYAAIQIFMVFFVLGSFLLFGEVIKRYFRARRIPFLSYLILCLIFINASGGVFIAKRPDMYSIPIISALAFTVFGLYFWLLSLRKEGRVDPFYAGIGSLCMALVAGCRPQLLLVSAMAIVIFWNSVFKDRTLFSKKGWKSTICICLPYILVAAGIMWYNYARFGSPFDFGANYNLTTNDMTGRGYRVERVGLSLFTYLFQLPNFTAIFPFLQPVTIGTNYLGVTITEAMFGGIFAVIPLLWVLFLLPSSAKLLLKKKLLALCLLPLGISVFIAAFDAQGAGLLQRYVSDFAFLACFSAIIMVFFLYEYHLGAERRRIHSFMRVALYTSGVYCFLCIFAKYASEIFYTNPYLFNRVAEMVQFW